MSVSSSSLRMAGGCFLSAFFFYGFGNYLAESPFLHPDALTTLVENSSQLSTGALLMLANSLAVVLTGIFLFKPLSGNSNGFAIAYLCSLVAEGVLLAIGVLVLLPGSHLAQAALNGQLGTTETTALPQWSAQAHFYAYQIGMTACGLGGMVLCYVLYRARMVHKGIALWGLIGYAALVLGCLMEMAGYSHEFWLTLPGGLFELVLGIMLLAGPPFVLIGKTNINLCSLAKRKLLVFCA